MSRARARVCTSIKTIDDIRRTFPRRRAENLGRSSASRRNAFLVFLADVARDPRVALDIFRPVTYYVITTFRSQRNRSDVSAFCRRVMNGLEIFTRNDARHAFGTLSQSAASADRRCDRALNARGYLHSTAKSATRVSDTRRHLVNKIKHRRWSCARPHLHRSRDASACVGPPRLE